jgi:cytosine deaminase
MAVIYKNASLPGKEGLYDIVVEDGKFLEIAPGAAGRHPGAQAEDLEGRLACAPFVDPHIHFDYFYTAALPDHSNGSGTLFEAIDNWAAFKEHLDAKSVRERALRGIRQMISNGVQYARTHVDVTAKKQTALEVMLELREELSDYMDIQIVAFPQEGYYAYEGGDKCVEQALREGADVVGGIPHYEFTREEGVKSIEKGFELAQKYGKLIDFHCDESDDEQSRFSEVLASLAWHNGMQGMVTASHTCAMGSYNGAYAFKMMSKYKKAGLNFISCPTENCYLQGRFDGFPQRRGLTRVEQLTDNGLNVCFAQDSISDPWYPLGSGSLIHQLDFGLHLAHMMTIPQIESSLKFVTTNGAKAMRVEDYGLKPGNSANFVVLDENSVLEAVRNEARVVLSVRKGRVIMRKQVEKLLTPMPQ